MPFAEVNGVTIRYEARGAGPTVLLIAPAGHPGSVWAFQVPVLAEHFRVVTFDNRATGESARPPGPYSIAAMAADAIGILDHLGVPSAHLVGWSMGGMIAQEIALSHPERVGRMVLLASAAHAKPLLRLMHEVEFAPGGNPRAAALAMMPWFYSPAFMTDERRVEAILERTFPPGAPPPDQEWIRERNRWINEAVRAFDSRQRLGSIAVETLVLVAEGDITLPRPYSEELAALIPRAVLQVLPRGNHGVPVECPADVNQALLRFLLA
ncbi:MAG: alpha/beta hydrolase [Dehalococcoidia bacterium]